MSRSSTFLQTILGLDGASALKKAIDREPKLGSALVPRAVLSWLGVVARGSYSGELPGADGVYFSMKKAEGNGYSGDITIGNEVYDFRGASVYHVAAAISLALGVDQTKVSDAVHNKTLQRLGKSIDTLVKSRTVQDLRKAISTIPAGQPMATPSYVASPPAVGTTKHFNYSHVLTPGQQQQGYSMSIEHRPESGTVMAHLAQNGKHVGTIKGAHFEGKLHIDDAELPTEHQGKGLGQAGYEGLMSHAFHNGIKTVAGGTHSTSASRVHQALARKHGMGYQATATKYPQLASPEAGPYDNKFGDYNYAIKTELPSTTHKPSGQQEPLAPQGPSFQTSTPKPLKKPKINVTKSEADRSCSFCSRKQFSGEKFQGCLCFSALAHGVEVQKSEKGFELTFKSDEWDIDAVEALRLALKTQS